jgi:drug/metabolite transporter (DMT)-like permease
MRAWSRYVGFVALNGSLVSAACYFLWRQLRFLANEPGSLLFWPMTVISLLALALLYPRLRRHPGPLFRAALLYLAFLASLVLYGGYLWLIVRGGTAMMIPLALVAGHLYGLPFLAGIWVVNTALARPLFGAGHENRS